MPTFADIAELLIFTRFSERQRRGHIPAQPEGLGHRCHCHQGLKARHKMLGVFALLTLTTALNAQTAPCGLTSMKEATSLVYPPIARVAHMEGTVVLMVRFDTTGAVSHVEPVYGPFQFKGVFEIFKNVSVTYAQGLKANSYNGPRECPVAITFRLTGPSDRECGANEPPASTRIQHVDLQHVIVVHPNVCVNVEYDSAGKRVHRFPF